MKIGIIGTRGIPNNYGGFEQCAEYLALGLVNKGHEVTVYNSHKHAFTDTEWKGVRIIHCFDPEFKLGTLGQFIYDLNCILDSRKRNFDVVLQLGYTSSSIWGWLLPRKSIITTNMDGLEWKRTKYSKPVQKFLLFAERLGVAYSDYLISDSKGIQNYLLNKYNKKSEYIPYGAIPVENANIDKLNPYHVRPYEYFLILARMEPENNIQTILDGIVTNGIDWPVLVIGGIKNKFALQMIQRYQSAKNIKFLGAIYDIQTLNSLRFFSALYFHGHSVGGTNPSLLEAMACSCMICAHSNEFNRAILGNDATYFNNSEDIAEILSDGILNTPERDGIIRNNLQKIHESYYWDRIVQQYEEHFIEIHKKWRQVHAT